MSFRDIDFAARRGPSIAVRVGLVAVLVVLAWGGHRALQAQQALDSMQEQLARQRQEAARTAIPAPRRPAPDKSRVKAVNEAIASLNVPWPSILGAVETVRPAGVALMHLEPRPADQTVLMTAQADDMTRLLEFMATVSATAPFTQARPVRQEQLSDTAGARKQATFEVRWEDAP